MNEPDQFENRPIDKDILGGGAIPEGVGGGGPALPENEDIRKLIEEFRI